MQSACEEPKTCPMCSAPLAVGGGVSMDHMRSRDPDIADVRSKVYVPCSAHTRIHLSSRPSMDGLSGMVTARCSGAGLVMARFSQTTTAPGESVYRPGPVDLSLIHISEPTRQAEISY